MKRAFVLGVALLAILLTGCSCGPRASDPPREGASSSGPSAVTPRAIDAPDHATGGSWAPLPAGRWQIILKEYDKSFIVSAEDSGEVLVWIDGLSKKPVWSAGSVGGKPPTWLVVVQDLGSDGGVRKPLRSLGIQSEETPPVATPQRSDAEPNPASRELTAAELTALREIFAKHGRPFVGTFDYGG